MLGLLAEPVEGEANANPKCCHRRYRNHFSVSFPVRASLAAPGGLFAASRRATVLVLQIQMRAG